MAKRMTRAHRKKISLALKRFNRTGRRKKR